MSQANPPEREVHPNHNEEPWSSPQRNRPEWSSAPRYRTTLLRGFNTGLRAPRTTSITTTVSVRVIYEVAWQVRPVGHPDTIGDYRIRAVRYGPFEPSDEIGRFGVVDVHGDAGALGVEA